MRCALVGVLKAADCFTVRGKIGEAAELSSLKERLRLKLFIFGYEIGGEERKVFETLKDREIIRIQYPNVHKLLRLVVTKNFFLLYFIIIKNLN